MQQDVSEASSPVAGPSSPRSGAASPVAGPSSPVAGRQPRSRPHRRRRVVLWSSLGVAAVVAVLIGLIAYARPSSQTLAQSVLVGKPAPPVSGPGLTGGHYSLAQFRGRWVLVNFMATWCYPCAQELPQLVKFADQHAGRGDAMVFTVAYDPSDASQLGKFLAARHAHWPAVNDPEASVSYGLTVLPSSFLVAPDGSVYAYVPGKVNAAELDRWIGQAGAQGAGRA